MRANKTARKRRDQLHRWHRECVHRVEHSRQAVWLYQKTPVFICEYSLCCSFKFCRLRNVSLRSRLCVLTPRRADCTVFLYSWRPESRIEIVFRMADKIVEVEPSVRRKIAEPHPAHWFNATDMFLSCSKAFLHSLHLNIGVSGVRLQWSAELMRLRNTSCIPVRRFSKFLHFYVWRIVWHTRTTGGMSASAKWKMLQVYLNGCQKAGIHRSRSTCIFSNMIATADENIVDDDHSFSKKQQRLRQIVYKDFGGKCVCFFFAHREILY